LLVSEVYALNFPINFPNKCLPRQLIVNGAANTYNWIVENQTQSSLQLSPKIIVGPIAPASAASFLGDYNISLFMLPTPTIKASI
jgi:hypothetical protein